MIYSDRQLTCPVCSADIPLSWGERDRYPLLAFPEDPRNCPACRVAEKDSRVMASAPGGSSGGEGWPGPMFPAVCADCGKATQIPFQPQGGRPVYCSDCFNRRR